MLVRECLGDHQGGDGVHRTVLLCVVSFSTGSWR
jgi:hypothetical protein